MVFLLYRHYLFAEYWFVIDFLTFEHVNILNPGNTWYTRVM